MLFKRFIYVYVCICMGLCSTCKQVLLKARRGCQMAWNKLQGVSHLIVTLGTEQVSHKARK